MTNDGFELYRRWLACGVENDLEQEANFVQRSFFDTVGQSSAYQKDALVNGISQPMVVKRNGTNKCNVIVCPMDRLYIGDLITVFNEYWICMEMYVDEYGMRYGELWMCNHIFCYQDFKQNIIRKHAILDDGSYSKGNDKAIAVADNSFNCYVSLDDESRALHIDKRLGISIIYDKNGNEVLEVGKIKWIDVKSRNFGEGSHLMVFGISEDPYSPDADNVKELICDYKDKLNDLPSTEQEGSATSPNGSTGAMNEIVKEVLVIDGRKTIRAGSVRTYTARLICENGNAKQLDDIKWSVVGEGVTIEPNGSTCRVSAREDDNLIGTMFTITCSCLSGVVATLDVEVT